MIKYRPKMDNLKYSLRDEQLFESMDDMLQFVFDRWRRVVSFMGSNEPFRFDEILISEIQGDDPRIGYKNVRRVCVSRMADKAFTTPCCIGFCGE